MNDMLRLTDYRIVEMMAQYGGSFARAIAAAARRADPVNLDKLKAAFPELWAEYAEVAKLKATTEAVQK